MTTFAELAVGDRFASGERPTNRQYQKISLAYAIDLSCGRNKRGEFIRDHFSRTYPVCLRNDLPQVEFDPAKLIEDK